MSQIVFNIETIADPDLQSELVPSPDDFTDFVKPETRKQKAEESATRLGIHALTSKIIALAYKVDDSDIQIIAGDDECMIARVFNTIMADDIPPMVVSYNGKNFDMHHLAVAIIRNGLEPEFNFPFYTRKYNTNPHIDLYEIMSNFGNDKRGKLSDWCIRFGITPPFGKGSLVTEWYQKGDWESIKHHCSDNVRCTYELLQKVGDLI